MVLWSGQAKFTGHCYLCLIGRRHADLHAVPRKDQPVLPPAFAFADPETLGHCDDASLSFWCRSKEAFLSRAFVCLFEMASRVALAGLELVRSGLRL